LTRLRRIYRGGGCYRNQRPTGYILNDKVASIGRYGRRINKLIELHQNLAEVVQLVIIGGGAELSRRVHLGRPSVKVLRRAREGDGIASSIPGVVIHYQQEGLTSINRETGHHGGLGGVM
jgi:hypothetical protein